MPLFAKAEYRKVYLPIRFISDAEDFEAGIISFEACGSIDGVQKYCYASFDLKDVKLYNGDGAEYEDIINHISVAVDKTAEVILKYKKGILKDFKFDALNLADIFNEQRLTSLELLGWGLNDKRFEDLVAEKPIN